MTDEHVEHIHLTTRIEGVVLPTWAAICLAIAAVLSMLTLALTILLASQQISTMAKEIRVLQLDVQDVKNVLIRNGIATEADFAPASGDDPSMISTKRYKKGSAK